MGGRATRLRRATDVPISKAFLPAPDGRPLLYWCLLGLEHAGVERVVIATDHPRQVPLLDRVMRDRTWRLAVRMFRDAGLGVHGIPWQARELLDDAVLFQAGHDVRRPDHYRMLASAAEKESGVAVFSGFRPYSDNPRFSVGVDENECVQRVGGEPQALALPMVIDRDYVDLLPEHGFNVAAMARTYIERDALRVIRAEGPVEFDVAREYRRTKNLLRSNAADCLEGTPWRAAPRPEAAEITQEGAIPAVVV